MNKEWDIEKWKEFNKPKSIIDKMKPYSDFWHNKAEIKKMLLAFRELASNYVNGQVDDDAIDKFIDEYLNQNKDE
jgi:hypothetical protein